MTIVDDAFQALKSNLEITQTEQDQASSRHTAIRDLVRANWSLEDDFLTGSYRRHTKTKKLRDVDIFVVIDPNGPQASLRGKRPTTALSELNQVLKQKYSRVEPDVFASVVYFGPEDEVTSFDVVPAFKRSAGGYEIPDTSSGAWISTNPKTHHELTTAKNKACGEMWVPLVKMVKGANRETGEPISPSFLIEVMALELVRAPMTSYQHEFVLFCAGASDNLLKDWEDPAHLGPPINRAMSQPARRAVQDALRQWQTTAENAIDLEADGSHRSAIEEWRKLFGNRMPRQ